MASALSTALTIYPCQIRVHQVVLSFKIISQAVSSLLIFNCKEVLQPYGNLGIWFFWGNLRETTVFLRFDLNFLSGVVTFQLILGLHWCH